VINNFWLNKKSNQLCQLIKIIQTPFEKLKEKNKLAFDIETYLYLFDHKQMYPLSTMNEFDDLNSELISCSNDKGTVFNLSMICETSSGCLLFSDKMHSGKFKKKGLFTKHISSFWKDCKILLESNFCFDEYHTDQMILYCCLAKGVSQLRTGPLSLHSQAVIELAKNYLNSVVDVEDKKDGSFILTIHGIDFKMV
jgi:hypothetical protein